MQKQNAIKVIIAVIFFAGAGALLAFNMGLFGGGGSSSPQDEIDIPATEGAGPTGNDGEFGGSDQAFRKPGN